MRNPKRESSLNNSIDNWRTSIAKNSKKNTKQKPHKAKTKKDRKLYWFIIEEHQLTIS